MDIRHPALAQMCRLFGHWLNLDKQSVKTDIYAHTNPENIVK